MEDKRWYWRRMLQDVPFSIVIVILFQTASFVIWMAKMEGRVDSLEQSTAVTEHRVIIIQESLTMLDRELRKIPLIDERQQRVLQTLEENARRLDSLNMTQQSIREEMLRQYRSVPQDGK